MDATGRYTGDRNDPRPASSTMFYAYLQELLRHGHPIQLAYNSMERARIAAYSSKRRWQHLRDCLLEQVLPKSMSCHKDSNAHGLAFPKHHEAMLRDQMDALRFEKQSKFAHLHHCKLAFRLHCPEHLYLKGLKFAHDRALVKDRAHVVKLADKLRRLCDSSSWSKAALHECVINKSAHTLTKHETQLLGLGLSFSLPPRSESVVNVLAAIQDLQAKAKDIAPELNTI